MMRALLAAGSFALVAAIPAHAAEGGASVSGHVSAHTGGAALAHDEVCAEEPANEQDVACAFTGSGGEYTLTGLPSASYLVAFARVAVCSPAPTQYAPQFYDHARTRVEAQVLEVSAGASYEHIDAQLEAESKPGVVAEYLCGGPEIPPPGEGSGTPPGGETPSGGHAPSPTAAKGGHAVLIGRARLVKGRILLELRCRGALACTGAVRLTARLAVPVRAHATHGKRSSAALRTVTLASKRFTLAAGKSRAMRLALAHGAGAMLRRVHRRSLPVRVLGSGVSAAAATLAL